MAEFQVWMTIISVVILFLFSLRKFSKQIQQHEGKKFKKIIRKITSTPLKGTLVGAGVTSLIQSSAATMVILLGLVHSGTISFYNSLGVIIGANIGTTITVQLAAFNLMYIAPIFIIGGFFIELFGKKYSVWGRPIFYFGLVFFSLSLIASYIDPIKSDLQVLFIFSHITGVFTAILAGFIITFLVQSSSLSSGLVIVLAGAGLVDLTQSIGIIFGANIGSTTTALISSREFGHTAKKTAFAHFMFNVIGVLIFLPFVVPFTNLITSIGGRPERLVANAHLIFNLTCAILFLVFLKPFERLIEKVYSKISKEKH
jgi:phosphate:Na+ symporter